MSKTCDLRAFSRGKLSWTEIICVKKIAALSTDIFVSWLKSGSCYETTTLEPPIEWSPDAPQSFFKHICLECEWLGLHCQEYLSTLLSFPPN